MPSALEIDFEEVNLEHYLIEVEERGVTYIPGFIRRDALEDLQRLCCEIEFTEISNTYEKVTEHYSVPERLPPQVNQCITALGEQLRQRFSAYAFRYPVLADWAPNDFSVHLYDDNSYITSHRDHASYKGIIAVVSIQGEANFEVREARHAEPITVWRTQPGDMMILRSSGFNLSIEGHPGIFHAVSGALTSTPRISIGFRQK